MLDGGAYIHHGLGDLDIVDLSGSVQNRDFVVIGQFAGAVLLIDLADALHAEFSEFGGPQRADAGSAVDMDALRHRPQDLLVPNRRYGFEIAVDDADQRRSP